eukprot:2023634-Rhodomonas_salina.1
MVGRAAKLGLFQPGFVWVVPDFAWLLDPVYASAAKAGASAAEMQQVVAGWFTVQLDFPGLAGLRRLQRAMEAEPAPNLNHSLIAS